MAGEIRETTVQVSIVPSVDKSALDKVKSQLADLGKSINFTVNVATSFGSGLAAGMAGAAAAAASGMGVFKSKVADAARAAGAIVPIKPQFDIGAFSSQMANMKSQYARFVTGISAQMPTGRSLAPFGKSLTTPERIYSGIEVQKAQQQAAQQRYFYPQLGGPRALAPMPGMPGGPPAPIQPPRYFAYPTGRFPPTGGIGGPPQPPRLPPPPPVPPTPAPPPTQPFAGRTPIGPYRRAIESLRGQQFGAQMQVHLLRQQLMETPRAEEAFQTKERARRMREEVNVNYARRRTAADRDFLGTPEGQAQTQRRVGLRLERQELAKEMRYAELTTQFGKLGGSIVYAEERFRAVGQTATRAFGFGMAGLVGAASAAGPATGGTLMGHMRLFAGEIGITLIPTIVRVSHFFQDLARQTRNLSESTKAHINFLTTRGLIAAGGLMVAGRVMGAASGVVQGLHAMGMMGPLVRPGAGGAMGRLNLGMIGGLGAGIIGLGLASAAAKGDMGAIRALEGLEKASVRLIQAFEPLIVAVGKVAGGVGGAIGAVPLGEYAMAAGAGAFLLRGAGGIGAAGAGVGGAAGAMGALTFPGGRGGPGGRFGGRLGGMAAGAGIGIGTLLLGESVTQRSVGGILGSAGGGALIGAAAGSFIPVIGTAIGAGLGAIGGMMINWLSARGTTPTQQARGPLPISTGFTSQQIAAEDLHSFIQQQVVRDPLEQAHFEQQMRALLTLVDNTGQIANNTGHAPPGIPRTPGEAT